MKKIVLFIMVSVMLTSCGTKNKGELIGVRGKKWYPEKPYGMSLIPGGAFIMGKSDDDVIGTQDAPPRTVTVRSYYMDETEITNNEYRSFVNWVRDSILRFNLAEMADLEGKTPGEDDIGEYAYLNLDEEDDDLTPYQQYMLDTYGNQQRKINNDIDLIYDPEEYPDVLYAEVVDNMLIPIEETYNGQRNWDVDQFLFQGSFIDTKKSIEQGKRVINIEQPVAIYPDTTVWIKDFEYSYNEPMHNDYFWHQAYGEYPVVGVSWKQARAFCQWRTMVKNTYQKSRERPMVSDFRLPSEAEWEYAARGGLEGATYPWGGPYIKNDRGCFMANFKPLRGNYAVDQALYTVEADAYEPNDYNLYNMAGNVAEWTNSPYNSTSYEFGASFNPTVSDGTTKRKVVRGGSWKDVAYYLQVSTRDYEFDTVHRSFIGFRTVQDFMGQTNTTNAATN